MDEITLVIWLLGAISTAFIAHTKGRSAGLWFVYGVLLWVVALPWALIMKPVDQESARA